MNNSKVIKNNLNEQLFLFLIIYIILKPSPTKLLGNILGLKIFDLIVFFMAIILYVFWSRSSQRVLSQKILNKKDFKIIMILLILLAIWSVISQFIAIGLPQSVIVIEDLLELYRYFSYVLLMYIGYLYGRKFGSKKFIYIYSFGTLISIMIAILQYFDFFGIRGFISLFYTDEKLRGIESNNPRVFGTFYNANWFALHLSIFVSYYFYRFLSEKKAFLYVFYSLMGVVGIIISGSRTGMILLAIGFIIVFIINIIKNFKISKVILFILVIIGFNELIKILSQHNNRVLELYQAVLTLNFSEMDSFTGRLESVQNFKELAFINPFSGLGFGNYYDLLPHNSYLLLLIQFGVIGIIIFILFWLVTTYFLFTKTIQYKNSIYPLSLLAVLLYCVAMFTGEYINSIQLASIIFLIIGVSYGEQKEFFERNGEK